MALIKCPECGKDFSDKADACPNCGCPAKSVIHEARHDAERSIKLLILFIGVLICSGLLFLGRSFVIGKNNNENNSGNRPLEQSEDTEKNKTAEPERRAWDAYFASQKFVKERMKSPSTAKFPSARDVTITPLEDGKTYKIYAYVDSQNSFGATIRTRYYLKVIEDGEYWKLLDIVFIAD